VQEQLRGNGRNGGAQVRNKTGAILRGLVQCGRCGSPMLHTFTTRKNRRHRYYICSRTHNEGATACPNTRVAAGPFELFVANQIRAIGRDDVVLAKTAASLAKLTADRRQELAAEQRRLEQQLRRAEQGDEQHALVAQRLDAVRNEAEAIDRGVTPNELRAALAGFDPVWGELFPAEQERILRLLIERITYHPDGGNVEIDLRPNGIDALEAEART
jgi:site-specific DNA recombinase